MESSSALQQSDHPPTHPDHRRHLHFWVSLREQRAMSRLSERQADGYRGSELETNDKALQRGVLLRLIESFDDPCFQTP